jgi:hypothetical protein
MNRATTIHPGFWMTSQEPINGWPWRLEKGKNAMVTTGDPPWLGGVHLVGDLSTESSEELGPGWARGFTPAGSVEGIQPKKCGYLSISWTYIIWSLRVCDVPNSDWCQRLSTYLRFDPEATMAHQKSWSPLVDDIHLGKKNTKPCFKRSGKHPHSWVVQHDDLASFISLRVLLSPSIPSLSTGPGSWMCTVSHTPK